MQMWGSLIELLSSPSDAIRMNTLWILGTAVQNNPSAQNAVSRSLLAFIYIDQSLVPITFPIAQSLVSPAVQPH